MKKINIYIIIIALTFSACKKSYIDNINKNPNNVTEELITPELVLPNAIVGAATRNVNFTWLNNWMGYWASSGSFAPSTEESTYNVTTTFQEGPVWNNYYNTLYDLSVVEKKSIASSKLYYAAAAKIIKAKLFQDLVDIYGNIPYSKAFDIKRNPTPAYDKGEDIYASLQTELDSAIKYFNTSVKPLAFNTADVLFQGNETNWIKFANTLKLKLLIRQTQVPSFSPTTEMAKIIANGGILSYGQSANVQPGFLNEITKQSTYYAAFGFLVNGLSSNAIVRANNYVLNIYKTQASGTDLRHTRFFRQATAPLSAANPYIGTTYGAPTNETFNGERTSAIGPGLIIAPTQPAFLTTSVEIAFLYAEAVERGWFGAAIDKQTAYENAVKESFTYLGMSTAAATNYIANLPVSYLAATNKISLIVNQKYLALCGINPLEAWCDQRRLNIPAVTGLISVNPAKISSTLPVRLLYPSNEYSVNSANTTAQGAINQFTSNIFWDK